MDPISKTRLNLGRLGGVVEAGARAHAENIQSAKKQRETDSVKVAEQLEKDSKATRVDVNV